VNKTKQLNIEIQEDLYFKIKEQAAKEHMSIKAWITLLFLKTLIKENHE
jgi:hypothetical protein